MKFKVRDSKKKCWVDNEFFLIGEDGELYQAFGNSGGYYEIEKNPDFMKPVFSTGKIDKNGVELFDGDELKTGHTIMIIDGCWCGSKYGSAGTKLGFYPLINMEKIGSKYEEK